MGKVFRFFTLLLFALPVGAKDFYIAQTAAGNQSGLSGCSNANTVAWFNNSSSWGAGTSQIGPGTTVHLCGTFTGTPGQQLLIVRGNGTSTSPITIKFESGAKLTAPYWSSMGAIYESGSSYITIDGGGTGVIQNTANGTGLQYQQGSRAIYASGCTGCVVQNIVISNLYVRTSISDLAPTQTAINCVYWLGANNFTVQNMTCHDAGWAVAGCGNNFTLASSNIYNIDHGLAFGAQGTASGFSIHDNHIHDYANWDSTTNAYHHDGLHLWGQNGGTVTNGTIYNNLFDGDSGVNITADIYLQDSIQDVSVYNNVFLVLSNRTNNVLWFAAASTSGMPGGPAMNNSAYNNFINGGGHSHGAAMVIQAQLNFTGANNVLMGGQWDLTIQWGGTLSAAGFDHNIFLDLSAYNDNNTFGYQGHSYQTLQQWQSVCHCDTHSKLVSVSQINAGSLGQPLSGSALIGAASNLLGVATGVLAPLAEDKLGVPRQTLGAWDSGAYRYGTNATVKPAAPSGLNAAIQ